MLPGLRTKFTTRVFLLATLFIFLISGTFTAIFLGYEVRTLRVSLTREGTLLARTLAHTARLGTLSQTRELLTEPLQGVMVNPAVNAAVIFSAEGKLLAAEGPAGRKATPAALLRLTPEQIRERLASLERGKMVVISSRETVEVWAPVVIRSVRDDRLFYGRDSAGSQEKMIGAAAVSIGDHDFRQRIIILVLQAVAVSLVFLAAGLSILYLLLQRITRPLNRLIASVNTLARGEAYLPVETEGKDELADLCRSFNEMAEALRRREHEKAQLEERLRQAGKLEALGTLAGGIAHDFNNILTAMIGFVNILEKSSDPHTSRQYVERLSATVTRAASLTKRLLAFSRKQNIHPVPADLNEILDDVRELVESIVGERTAVIMELSREPLWAMVDRGQIDQVVLNVAANARDAMPAGGTFRMRTAAVELNADFFAGYDRSKPGRYALLSLSDSGPGISEEVLERMFDPFFTTKEVGKGTGLGLSMSYGIVQQHNGFISVETEAGKGTSFLIYLPLIDIAPGEEGKKEERQTVLVAEDDKVSREFISRVLTSEGFRVLAAADAGEAGAVFMAHEKQIDAVMINIIMPGGQQAYGEMKKRRNVPTVFIGGYVDAAAAEEALDKDLAYVVKPVRSEQILGRLRRLLAEG